LQRKREGVEHLKPVPAHGTVTDPPQAQPKYRADEFIIPAHDEKEQSIPYSFRAGKRYASVISELVWSRRFPYKTPGDVYRHALDRHLKWLESIEPGPMRDSLAQIDIINEGIKKAEAAVAFGDSITRLEQTVTKLVSSKLRGMAVQLVYQIRKQARQIDHPLLRDLFLEQIQTRFGHLFSGEAMSLSATSDAAVSDDEEAMHRSWGYERDTDREPEDAD